MLADTTRFGPRRQRAAPAPTFGDPSSIEPAASAAWRDRFDVLIVALSDDRSRAIDAVGDAWVLLFLREACRPRGCVERDQGARRAGLHC
jgi:hypothetical protein